MEDFLQKRLNAKKKSKELLFLALIKGRVFLQWKNTWDPRHPRNKHIGPMCLFTLFHYGAAAVPQPRLYIYLLFKH